MQLDQILTTQQQKALTDCLRYCQQLNEKKTRYGITPEQQQKLMQYFKRKRQLLSKIREQNA